MEHDESQPGHAASVTIHQAEGLLSALLDVPVEDAAVSLDLKAQFSGVSLVDAAQQVLDDHTRRMGVAGPRTLDDRALMVLRQHLDRVASPLDLPTH